MKKKAYLTVLDNAFEIYRPNSEEKNQNMKSHKPTKHDGSIYNVNTWNDKCHPGNIENGKGPNIQTPSPMFFAQQINILHNFATNMKSRHFSSCLHEKRSTKAMN